MRRALSVVSTCLAQARGGSERQTKGGQRPIGLQCETAAALRRRRARLQPRAFWGRDVTGRIRLWTERAAPRERAVTPQADIQGALTGALRRVSGSSTWAGSIYKGATQWSACRAD